MRKNFHILLLALSALILASLACEAVTSSGGSPAPAATPTAAPASQATEPPAQASETAQPAQPQPTTAPVASPGTGIACLGTKDVGVACLDGNGWKTYTDKNSQLASNYITAMTTCPDGRMVFAHYTGISLFDGQNWSGIGNGDFTSVNALACDKEGGLWVAHFQGISHFAAGQWTKYGSDQLATGDSASELVYDIAVGPDGTIWAVTANSVAAFDGKEWTIYQQGRGFDDKLYFNAIAFDLKGHPVVSHGNGLAIFADKKWTVAKSPDYISTVKDMTVDTQGRVWLGTSIDGVYTFDNGAWNNLTLEKSDLSSNSVNALAADGSGRVWVGTEYGLSVFADGKWQIFRMDNSDLPANDISGVAVIAAGPTLPATADKAPGKLTGQVKDKNGSPIANSAVEICVEVIGSQFFGDTPCSDQPYFLTGKTDGEGKFSFDNVPAGYYTIVMKVGDGWAQLTGEFGFVSEQVLIKPGETTDVGDITMKE